MLCSGVLLYVDARHFDTSVYFCFSDNCSTPSRASFSRSQKSPFRVLTYKLYCLDGMCVSARYSVTVPSNLAAQCGHFWNEDPITRHAISYTTTGRKASFSGAESNEYLHQPHSDRVAYSRHIDPYHPAFTINDRGHLSDCCWSGGIVRPFSEMNASDLVSSCIFLLPHLVSSSFARINSG